MINQHIHEHGSDDTSIDTGTPISVTLDYVEAQLTQLWRSVAEAAQVKGGVSAVTMAQVLNLIVRADSHKAAEVYTIDINNITGSHPARVINVITDPTEEELPVQAWVSIHCQLPPSGGRQVCAEQVSVVAGGGALRQVPAAVIPLLLPDLPVFLWWPKGSPFDEYLFRQLEDSLNRLIVDSSTFENPEGTLARMSTLLKNEWPTTSCTDMNWGRVTRWREMVAQFFDGTALRPYLDRIGQVTIDFALSKRGGPVNRAQALLAAGWLASRLGWQPVAPVYEVVRSEGDRPAAARLSLQFGGRHITVLLRPSADTSDVPGDIRAIKLEVPGEKPEDSPEARFEVCLPEEDDCAWTSIEIAGSTPSKRNFQMETPSRVMLLDAELEVFSRDRVYNEALEMAGVFIRGTAKKEKEDSRRSPSGEPVSTGAQRQRGK